MKKISIGLSVSSIQNAIKELRAYQDELNSKCEELCARLCAEGIGVAKARIGASEFGQYVHLYSQLTPTQTGCRAVFCMADKAPLIQQWRTRDGVKSAEVSGALMLEFGSGIEAQNPAGIPGVGQGTFPGQTHAFDSGGWWYMDLNGTWHHSTGVEPRMPMYYAGEELKGRVAAIAREVFG